MASATEATSTRRKPSMRESEAGCWAWSRAVAETMKITTVDTKAFGFMCEILPQARNPRLIIKVVSKRAALYQQFDPTHPLEADEEALYVDWQKKLGLDDVKIRLAESIALSGSLPVCRLFTGHR